MFDRQKQNDKIMRTYSHLNIFLLAGLILIFGACSVNRNLPLNSVKTDGLYGDTLVTDSSSLADLNWDQLFTDSLLLQLIHEGLDNNLDLKVAVQREMEAEAYFKQSRAALLPGISGVASGSYSHNSESIYPNGPMESNVLQLGGQANWEIDLWGKLKYLKRAAYADFLASDAGRRAVLTRLIADIATAYYNLLSLDAKLSITQKTVLTDQDVVDAMRTLQSSGKVNGAAVVQSEAAKYGAEVIIPDLRQQILEAQNSLSLLLGRSGSTIKRGQLDDQSVPPAMTIGIPARLLDNRPDVVQAKYAVMSAFEMTRSARRYFYPSLTITAGAGLAAVKLDELFNPTSFASNIVAGLTQPIFNKRANITRLRVAKSEQEVALLNFKGTLLNAGNEVQDALGSYNSSLQKISLREKQIQSLENALSYTRELLTYGSANYTEVLYAQQNLLSAQLNGVNDKVQQLTAVISLYRALGGGWK